MSPSEPPLPVEHLEDFMVLEWCNKLLSDPHVTNISKRVIPDKREGVSNTFFTRTLFADGAIRAFLSLYKPGNGERRVSDRDVFTGSAPLHEIERPDAEEAEARRQMAREEKIYDVNDPDTPEAIILASLGSDLDGGIRRVHGGVTASLLDQVMGTLISYAYQHRCATSHMTVRYKAAVDTPCVLLVRAKLVRERGRYIETMGWLEDGHGKVFAECDGAFVMNKLGSPKI
ncbi:hypothetical protein EK21DRAFT_81311 [Setomelanomma holmii]|uniref:Thioesterase domain-containing protein n=1 Tax=Setomelanomma holmii TaxID=210430 RepID=A0A9P4GX24_9PLEO|nr:hypothetical protein EK21DRAFT_81311 [Setomelanomma holmii]